MPKVVSSKESAIDVKKDAKLSKTSIDKIWSVASKSAMLLKKPKTVGKGKNRRLKTFVNKNGEVKNVPVRTIRTLKKHSIAVLLSGAFADVAGEVSSEATLVNSDAKGEKTTAPALPVMTPGAALLFEQAITAYTQSVFLTGLDICEGVGLHQKVTSNCMIAAAQITNNRISSASMIPTVQTSFTAWKVAPKKKVVSRQATVAECCGK